MCSTVAHDASSNGLVKRASSTDLTVMRHVISCRSTSEDKDKLSVQCSIDLAMVQLTGASLHFILYDENGLSYDILLSLRPIYNIDGFVST